MSDSSDSESFYSRVGTYRFHTYNPAWGYLAQINEWAQTRGSIDWDVQYHSGPDHCPMFSATPICKSVVSPQLLPSDTTHSFQGRVMSEAGLSLRNIPALPLPRSKRRSSLPRLWLCRVIVWVFCILCRSSSSYSLNFSAVNSFVEYVSRAMNDSLTFLLNPSMLYRIIQVASCRTKGFQSVCNPGVSGKTVSMQYHTILCRTLF